MDGSIDSQILSHQACQNMFSIFFKPVVYTFNMDRFLKQVPLVKSMFVEKTYKWHMKFMIPEYTRGAMKLNFSKL